MSISNDKFLFQCLEYEKGCVKNNKPVFDQRFEPGQANLRDAESTLDRLVTHYKKQLHLDIEKNFELTEENSDEVIPAVVGMVYDLKELSDKLDENINPDDYTDESSSWCILDSLVGKHLSPFRSQLMNYLKWCFVQAKTDQKPSSNANRPPRAPRGPRAPGQSRDHRGNGGGGGRFGNREQRNPRDGGGRGGRFGKGGPRKIRSHNPEVEERAITNAKESIELMKTDTSMAELRLEPANSYHRRLQHQLITQDDLFSYSEGEGKERSVVITRDETKNSTPYKEEE